MSLGFFFSFSSGRVFQGREGEISSPELRGILEIGGILSPGIGGFSNLKVSSDLLSYSLGWSNSALLRVRAYKGTRNES